MRVGGSENPLAAHLPRANGYAAHMCRCACKHNTYTYILCILHTTTLRSCLPYLLGVAPSACTNPSKPEHRRTKTQRTGSARPPVGSRGDGGNPRVGDHRR